MAAGGIIFVELKYCEFPKGANTSARKRRDMEISDYGAVPGLRYPRFSMSPITDGTGMAAVRRVPWNRGDGNGRQPYESLATSPLAMSVTLEEGSREGWLDILQVLQVAVAHNNSSGAQLL
ncbi:hypothetical protein B0H17DRAFT_1126538 [Mycena rosella]|uniref:Uncharacterized protein n=1 Tax=Mycena rosella TaxID=1033263 RepID=A0AAD7GTE5_MYCRO|nr:hypothetical protein B0H17DRAFT_1126538 [Mycena rosella]